ITWVGVRLYVWLIAVAPGLLLALGCVGWGDLFGRLVLRKESDPMALGDRCLFAFACGMSIVALVTLEKAISQFLVFDQALAVTLLFIGTLVGLPLWKAVISKLVPASGKIPEPQPSSPP